jgi:hypothetical protein
MNKRNAVAFEVTNIAHGAQPGAYEFILLDGERIGITHACPCGCGELGALFFKKYPVLWSVEGEWPKVTMKPSIGFWGKNRRAKGEPFHWHGYLINGVFEEV